MVATTFSTSVSGNNPPLSYAERAKKGTPAASLPSASSATPATTARSAPGAPPSFSSARSTTSSTGFPSSASSSVDTVTSSTSPPPSVTPSSSVPLTRPSTPPLSRSHSPPFFEEKHTGPLPNGTHNSINGLVLTDHQPPPPSSSKANVWTLRKEQMAARQATATTSSSSVSTSASASVSSTPVIPGPSPPLPVSSQPPSISVSTSHPRPTPTHPTSTPVASSTGKLATRPLNGKPALSNKTPPNGLTYGGDPSVDLKDAANTASLPPLSDSASWPEMGTSSLALSVGNELTPTPTRENPQPPPPLHATRERGREREKERTGDTEEREKARGKEDKAQPTTNKKAEKTKWVPIPPAELRAAFDAVSRPHGHGHHHGHERRAPSTSSHSSPRPPGRGKRLPPEDPTTDGNGSAGSTSASGSVRGNGGGKKLNGQSRGRNPGGSGGNNYTVSNHIRSHPSSKRSSPTPLLGDVATAHPSSSQNATHSGQDGSIPPTTHSGPGSEQPSQYVGYAPPHTAGYATYAPSYPAQSQSGRASPNGLPAQPPPRFAQAAAGPHSHTQSGAYHPPPNYIHSPGQQDNYSTFLHHVYPHYPPHGPYPHDLPMPPPHFQPPMFPPIPYLPGAPPPDQMPYYPMYHYPHPSRSPPPQGDALTAEELEASLPPRIAKPKRRSPKQANAVEGYRAIDITAVDPDGSRPVASSLLLFGNALPAEAEDGSQAEDAGDTPRPQAEADHSQRLPLPLGVGVQAGNIPSLRRGKKTGRATAPQFTDAEKLLEEGKERWKFGFITLPLDSTGPSFAFSPISPEFFDPARFGPLDPNAALAMGFDPNVIPPLPPMMSPDMYNWGYYPVHGPMGAPPASMYGGGYPGQPEWGPAPPPAQNDNRPSDDPFVVKFPPPGQPKEHRLSVSGPNGGSGGGGGRRGSESGHHQHGDSRPERGERYGRGRGRYNGSGPRNYNGRGGYRGNGRHSGNSYRHDNASPSFGPKLTLAPTYVTTSNPPSATSPMARTPPPHSASSTAGPSGDAYGYPAYDASYGPTPSASQNAGNTSQAAPLPTPITPLSFPLDSTRYYLLGQVEYYFSMANLSRDSFLRKQMDSRGWVPVHVIASFNRMRRLTTDMSIIFDTIQLSSVVELRSEHVRLRNRAWEAWVLPTAPDSTIAQEAHDDVPFGAYAHGYANMPYPNVEYHHGQHHYQDYQPERHDEAGRYMYPEQEPAASDGFTSVEGTPQSQTSQVEEEEEEEEVVFVMQSEESTSREISPNFRVGSMTPLRMAHPPS